MSRTILLVATRDDVAAEITSGLAGRPGLSFVRVGTPQLALAILDGEHGDHGDLALVVADNDTHPTGGFFLAKEVAARRTMGADVPRVLLVLARPQDRWLSDWSQADAYVVRPVDPFDLAEAVDALVAGEPLPELPGIGGDPVEGPYDLPSGRRELGGTDAAGSGVGAGGL